MTISRRCKFYRDSEGTSTGMGLGYCDFDGSQAICDGDMQFCEKPNALKKYLLEENNNGKVLGEGKNSFQRIRNYEYGENDRFLGPSYPDK